MKKKRTSQNVIMVTVNIKISNSSSNGIASTVRFLADFLLFISDVSPAHLDPPHWALFSCVLCKCKAGFLDPLFKWLVVNLSSLLIRFYRKKNHFCVLLTQWYFFEFSSVNVYWQRTHDPAWPQRCQDQILKLQTPKKNRHKQIAVIE